MFGWYDLSENGELGGATQEITRSVRESNASVVRALLVARLRVLGAQSKGGVLVAFLLLLGAGVFAGAKALDWLPLGMWAKVAFGTLFLVVSVHGAYALLKDAEVI